jgi:pSer/pThr/pTyr-binding forkhead associated (FHA) protein
MLKIKLLNSKIPTERQELDISPEVMINGECFIGRSRNCGVVLPSVEVSRVHSSIRYEEGEYYFCDMASLTGSRINDQAAGLNQRYLLKKDDIIRIGEFILTVEATGSATDKAEVAPVLEAQSQTPTLPQATYTIPIPQVSQQPSQPTRSPSEYMPIALVPPEQISRWTKGDLMVRCIAIIDETDDVKTFRFAADPPILFTYQPGQFMTLNLEINGKPVKRSYSISSTPSRPPHFRNYSQARSCTTRCFRCTAWFSFQLVARQSQSR